MAQDSAAEFLKQQREQSALQQAMLTDLRWDPSLLHSYKQGHMHKLLTHASAASMLWSSRPTAQTHAESARRDVSDSTKGVAGALEAIAHYQRRSDAVLVHLLGRSYGVSDVLVMSALP